MIRKKVENDMWAWTEGKVSLFFHGIILFFTLLFAACNGRSGDSQNLSHSEKVKLQQYMVSGRQLYMQHCSNCHQSEGQGLARLYPPIDKADFVDHYPDKIICIIKYGIEGEIMVNGVSYNQPMPAIPQLSDLEVAEIATYVYNSWGREQGLVDVKQVRKVLEGCR